VHGRLRILISNTKLCPRIFILSVPANTEATSTSLENRGTIFEGRDWREQIPAMPQLAVAGACHSAVCYCRCLPLSSWLLQVPFMQQLAIAYACYVLIGCYRCVPCSRRLLQMAATQQSAVVDPASVWAHLGCARKTPIKSDVVLLEVAAPDAARLLFTSL
jgi:hypothetical protein